MFRFDIIYPNTKFGVDMYKQIQDIERNLIYHLKQTVTLTMITEICVAIQTVFFMYATKILKLVSIC